jgi:hydrogenase-4 component B
VTPADAILAALGLHVLAGLTGFAPGRSAERLATLSSALGSTVGLVGACGALAAPRAASVSAAWPVPGGEILLRVDALAAAFLLVIFLVSGLGAIFGLGYWPRKEQPRTAARVRFFWALMTVGLGLVVLAANALLFLLAWELMAVSAFFLVATDDDLPGVRRAAWVYLVATHVGTACLLAAFALLRAVTGSFELQRIAAGPAASAVFLLGLAGFGLKAGLVPLHFWLPAAHANAPSHVSALMSGVMLKAGVYGILRFSGLVDAPPLWWGLLLAALGATSAVVGIALASGQTDLKRALAYSSVENVGIISLGIGLALAGRSLGQPAWVALGFGGSLFHVFSHACFKSLLFFGSGGILHAAGTRNMELLGGLHRRMPVTASLFLVGSLAAVGLPLFNGFVGEWLVAVGLVDTLRRGPSGSWLLAFGAPAIAFAGALALASFARIVGVTFLGGPRSAPAARAHEPSRLIVAPMAVLAAACVALGLWPFAALPALNAAEAAWLGRPVDAALLAAPLASAVPVLAVLAAALAAGAAALLFLAPPPSPRVLTWDCGYAEPTPRMQTSASSFGGSITALLPAFLVPSSLLDAPRGPFPRGSSFRSDAPDPFGARAFEPMVARWAGRLARFRRLQSGRLSLYLVYVFLTTLVTLAWSVVRPWIR